MLLFSRLPETAVEVALATLESQMSKNLQIFPGNLTLAAEVKERRQRGVNAAVPFSRVQIFLYFLVGGKI